MLNPVRSVAALLLCAMAASSSSAQCTPTPSRFCVTVGEKTPSSPNPGGWTQAWYINGAESLELFLVRGRAYEFKANSVSIIHPFQISTNDVGGGVGVWTEGVVPSGGITGNSMLTFTVPFSAPDLLYYQCKNHQRMGWKIHILCPADFDRSGFVDTDDFDAFVVAFVAGDDAADFDQSGFVDTDDFDKFVLAFEGGC